jgi:hypothetical protein
MLGCMVRARSNTWLTAFSLSPAHFDRIMLGLMDSRLNSASAATFSTNIVCRTGSKRQGSQLDACMHALPVKGNTVLLTMECKGAMNMLPIT